MRHRRRHLLWVVAVPGVPGEGEGEGRMLQLG